MKILDHTPDYDYEKLNYLSDQWILLNIGNLRELFFNGSMYDKNPKLN